VTGRRARRALSARLDQLGGLAGTARRGNLTARALAVADSRSLVRCVFLASAVRSGILDCLAEEPTLAEIVRRYRWRRPDRLESWLAVGVDLGELRRRGTRYALVGRRAVALAAGDELLRAHYRTMLEYQIGPYAELEQLLSEPPGTGRGDLERYAEEIAQVSLAAEPFVARAVRRAVAERRPRRVLDVGCGNGTYSAAVLGTDANVEVEAIDLAGEVAEAAGRRLVAAGFGTRARVHVGDVRDWLAGNPARFDLVLLLDNVYYFAPEVRPELYRQLYGCLAPGGELVVATMTAPGSVAAAHLDFMLACQEGSAALPHRDELRRDLEHAGFDSIEERSIVPTEPFVAVRARARAPRHQ